MVKVGGDVQQQKTREKDERGNIMIQNHVTARV